jgi:gliding motility-associated-like protein
MVRKLLLPILLFFVVQANAQSFVNSINSAGLPSTSGEILGVLDYNNDGFPDLVYADELTGNILFYKNVNGVYSDQTAFLNFPSLTLTGSGNESAIPFDYNGDGFVDILMARSGVNGTLRLIQNNCGANFTDVTTSSQIPTNLFIVPQYITNDPMILISDYDRDNDNDILVSSKNTADEFEVRVIKNNGVSFAAPSTLLTGFGATTVPYFAILDYDNDKDDDLLVIKNSNFNAAVSIDLYDYSSGSYSIQGSTGLSNNSPVGFATILDIDNDGFDDVLLGTKEVVSPGPGNNGNRVFRNNGGNATFTNVTGLYNTYQSAITGDNFMCHAFDFDNDGDLDVIWEVKSNGLGSNRPAFRTQTAPGLFVTNNGLNLLSTSSATRKKMVVLDYNNDGKLDVFGETATGGSALMRNNTIGANYLKVKLYACNGHGIPIGSKVYTSANGLTQFKAYNFSQTFTSTAATSNELHFGLGNNSTIDTVIAFFPDFGNIVTLTNVAANQTIKMVDGSCTIAEPLVFEFPTDTNNVCGVSETFISAPSGFVNYSWKSGESTPDILVNKEGWYVCTATNAAGCSATDSIFVGFGFGYVTPTDTIVCKGSSVSINAYPRYDCSPFGAPAKAVVNGQALVDYSYAGEFNGHHYYIANRSNSWRNAAREALAMGGVLASINNVEEQTFIENNLTLTGKNMWLGLYNVANDPFVWMNCDTLNFTNWAGGGPTPDPTRNFVFFRSDACPEGRFWKNTINDPLPGDPCENDIFALVEFDNATNISYQWSTGDTTATINVTPSTTSGYFVSIQQNGKTCFGSSTINIVDVNNLIPFDSLTECKASFTFIQATEGLASYSWSNGRTTSGINVFANGWYKVTATSTEGCIGSDSVYVTIYNTSIRTPDTLVCAGVTVFLRGPAAPLIFQTDYTQDFQIGGFPGWNSLSTINYGGSRVLGPFANDSITYNQANLPTHDSVMVTFDLFIHDTWEGNCSTNGPDLFRFKNGTTNIINTTFSNTAGCTQGYANSGIPGTYPAFNDAAATGLVKRCDATPTSTTKYTITRKFRHSASDLNLSWVGDLRDAIDNSTKCNESWSIDNISIQLRREGGLLWSTGESTQNIFVVPNNPSNEYWVRIPVGNSFCYDTVVVSTTVGELPFNLITSDTFRICGYPSNISVSTSYDTYEWNTGENTNPITVYNTGWYKIKASLSQGCFVNDSVYVPFHFLETAPSDTSVCLGNPVTLRVNYNNDCSPFGGPANTGYKAKDTIPGYDYKGEYQGHYYYQSESPSTWSVAAQNALAAGGQLANIYDVNELGFIRDNIIDNTWIGLYKNPIVGYHFWMNCDSLTINNWASAEPAASPADYVFMYGATCTEPFKWKSHVDDPSSLSDPCLTNIYGLLEIEPWTYEYYWYDNSFNLISNSETLLVNPTSNATYRAFHALYPNGPNCNSGSANITVIDDNFSILQDSVEKVNCQGDTVMLVATPGFSNYNWDNGQTGQIAVYSDTVGWVFCTYDNGTCVFKDSAYLNVPKALSPNSTVTNLKCKGDKDAQAFADATGGTLPYNFFWNYNGSTAQLQTNLSPNSYVYAITDQIGCIVYDTIVINEPDTALSLKINVLKGISCNGDSNGILFPAIIGGEKPYIGNWNVSGIIDTLFNAKIGKYIYTLTDNRGCLKKDSVTLTQPQALVLNASIQKQIFCAEDSNGVVILGASGGTLPYLFSWNGAVATNDTLFNVYKGSFKARVTDKNGCKDSAVLTMVQSNTDPNLCGITISSGFTPNGDGRNDFFYIKGLEGYPDNELTVFNRWGETVFSAINYKNDWEGKPDRSLINTADGLVPNDTYFYVFKTKANNKTYSGYVYITR